MRFNSSVAIENDYFEAEDSYVSIEEEIGLIRFQKSLVRYSPVDDYRLMIDEEVSFAEFGEREDLKELVRSSFSEITLKAILTKIFELS